MKFTLKPIIEFLCVGHGLEVGDQREIETFLLLPRSIDGDCRWLRRARIKQEVKELTSWAENGVPIPYKDWVNVEWLD